jgi:phosphoribosylaminoimidazole-succinocarboxamide synthase
MKTLLEQLPIIKSHRRGKVREIYELEDTLLFVTSDRISAFDVVFNEIIPDKGRILNQISAHFFKLTKDIVPNHFITDNVDEYPAELQPYRDELAWRSMLVRKTRVVPFECIVRGYITGSAWKEYIQSGTMGGVPLPTDMRESQPFEKPCFTPSTKAEEGHDINISPDEMAARMDPALANTLTEKSLALYQFAHDDLDARNIILADTKFEFGTIGGDVILIDEIFTPDSSRFWDKASFEVGTTPMSYDKQFLRNYLETTGWNKQPPAPALPAEIIEKTRERYRTAYLTITGESKLPWE